jgi:Protein of unknown function (DUF3179)
VAPPLVIAALTALALAACGGGDDPERAGEVEADDPGAGAPSSAFGAAPDVPEGELATETEAALDELIAAATSGVLDRQALDVVAPAGDARLAWLISDLLRFFSNTGDRGALADAFAELTGADPRTGASAPEGTWVAVTDRLIAWDLPAPPGYVEHKAELFLAIEPDWRPFFEDADAAIDWRLVSWGGVLIDDRPVGDEGPCPRSCIPALDDPELTAAEEGGWYPDERTVFGVVVGGEAVALPKNIMEVHEMVNMTLGGRRLGIPYCTLCGSAQAYFLDEVPGRELVLRTSGLLSRSNKVMYELNSRSVFDTFSGEALSGPLHDAGVTLEQTTVVASTWGAWKRRHPGTMILAEDGGIGRDYPLDPLGGRDDDGPIFPIGDVDPRQPVHERVIGVIAPDGTAVAFPSDEARAALAAGESIRAAGVELVSDGDGFRARALRDGRDLAAHEAFWFAWSQFNPGTELWRRR